MNIDRKTPVRISFYSQENNDIHSWPFQGNIRLALLMHTLTGEKEKLERGDLTDEQKKLCMTMLYGMLKDF